MVCAGEGPAPVSLLPEASWAPLACVLVHCVRPTGEIVNDLIWLPIAPTLSNKVQGACGRFSPGLGSDERNGGFSAL